MSLQSINPSRGGSIAWAWKLIDRHRRRDHLAAHQIEIALDAIENIHRRRPIPGSGDYAFSDEDQLRKKVIPQ
jgi:hypothetical protein